MEGGKRRPVVALGIIKRGGVELGHPATEKCKYS
jgi:hypothetical protein